MRKVWAVGILLVLWGCKTLGTASVNGESSYSTYREDLSGSFPKYQDYQTLVQQAPSTTPTTSAQTVDASLDEVQKKLTEKNKSEPYFNGYTVLVYSGIDRNQAFRTRDEMASFFPEITPEMQYQEPRYLVKIGRYAYKFEAQKNFSKIKTLFPTARIIQDRFQRKEYVAPQLNPNAQGQN
jgi:hypothetical protein